MYGPGACGQTAVIGWEGHPQGGHCAKLRTLRSCELGFGGELRSQHDCCAKTASFNWLEKTVREVSHSVRLAVQVETNLWDRGRRRGGRIRLHKEGGFFLSTDYD
jgi:hypothetical protein